MRVHPKHFTRRPKKELPLAMILLLATVFAFGLNENEQNKADASQSTRLSQANILVATRDLAAATTISAEDVVLELRSLDSMPRGMTTDLDMLIGKTTRSAISKGSPILTQEVISTTESVIAIQREEENKQIAPEPSSVTVEVQQPLVPQVAEKETANSRQNKPATTLKKSNSVIISNVEQVSKERVSAAPRPKKRGYVWIPGNEKAGVVDEKTVRPVPSHGTSRFVNEKRK